MKLFENKTNKRLLIKIAELEKEYAECSFNARGTELTTKDRIKWIIKRDDLSYLISLLKSFLN